MRGGGGVSERDAVLVCYKVVQQAFSCFVASLMLVTLQERDPNAAHADPKGPGLKVLGGL